MYVKGMYAHACMSLCEYVYLCEFVCDRMLYTHVGYVYMFVDELLCACMCVCTHVMCVILYMCG